MSSATAPAPDQSGATRRDTVGCRAQFEAGRSWKQLVRHICLRRLQGATAGADPTACIEKIRRCRLGFLHNKLRQYAAGIAGSSTKVDAAASCTVYNAARPLPGYGRHLLSVASVKACRLYRCGGHVCTMSSNARWCTGASSSAVSTCGRGVSSGLGGVCNVGLAIDGSGWLRLKA